jgi:hypothetical protein
MNQGFSIAATSFSHFDWLLFWGSDDLPATITALADAMAVLSTSVQLPDLLICNARYFNSSSGALCRRTGFRHPGLLVGHEYRRSLLIGRTPPHQATFFGPGARQRLACYASGFRLSADLDYFLQLSLHPGLRVQCLDLELVHMADGGVSGQQTQRRLQEVRRAYRRAFGWRWWFPFLMRYLRRVASLLERSR